MRASTWSVTVRIENDGKFAEYDDTISVLGPDDPTSADLISTAKDMIVAAHPEMKAGRTVQATAVKVNGD